MHQRFLNTDVRSEPEVFTPCSPLIGRDAGRKKIIEPLFVYHRDAVSIYVTTDFGRLYPFCDDGVEAKPNVDLSGEDNDEPQESTWVAIAP